MARNFLKEDEEDAAVVSGPGGLCPAADHPGKHRIRDPAAGACFEGVAAGQATEAEIGEMRPLPFALCLAVCALCGAAVGAVVGNPVSGVTTGLAAGAAIAGVLILLGGEVT